MEEIKIWLDDVRPAPEGYEHTKSVNETIKLIEKCQAEGIEIAEFDLDHDLGDYAHDGGDAIRLLDYLAEFELFYPIKFHTANPVGRANMQRVVDRFWPI